MRKPMEDEDNEIRQSSASPASQAEVPSPEQFVKRRKLSPDDDDDSDQLANGEDANFSENLSSPATSGALDHVPVSCCSSYEPTVTGEVRSRSPDLKVEFGANRFQTQISCSDIHRRRSNCRPKWTKTDQAETPSAAEIEQFFSEAEKYNLKAFAEKYNYDPVNDVPLEGRYQWILLNP